MCSPSRDGDATTKALREVQAAAGPDDIDAIWLTAIARAHFGTERFVRKLGLVRPSSLEDYVDSCINAALAVAAEGFHACTDAYTEARIGFNRERTAWRRDDVESLREQHEGDFARVATEAWQQRGAVRDAVRSRNWA